MICGVGQLQNAYEEDPDCMYVDTIPVHRMHAGSLVSNRPLGMHVDIALLSGFRIASALANS